MTSQPTAASASASAAADAVATLNVRLTARDLRLIYEALLTDAGRRQVGSPIQRELTALAGVIVALGADAPRDGYRLVEG